MRFSALRSSVQEIFLEIMMVPEAFYTLINTSISEDPAVVVVNSALRNFAGREAFPWHLSISIGCRLLAERGMPTAEEVDVLNFFEDAASPLLEKGENAIFLARITARGRRVLIYRVRDPELADAILQSLVSSPEQLREWDYRMEIDSDWTLAQPELRLLERDRRFN